MAVKRDTGLGGNRKSVANGNTPLGVTSDLDRPGEDDTMESNDDELEESGDDPESEADEDELEPFEDPEAEPGKPV